MTHTLNVRNKTLSKTDFVAYPILACAEVKRSEKHVPHGIRKLTMTWASFNGRSFFPSTFSKRGRDDDEHGGEAEERANALDGFYPNVDREDDPDNLETPGHDRYQDEGQETREGWNFRSGKRVSQNDYEDDRFASICSNFFYKGTLPRDKNDKNRLFDSNPMLADGGDDLPGPVSLPTSPSPSGPRSFGFDTSRPSKKARLTTTSRQSVGSIGDTRLQSVSIHGYVSKIPRAALFNKDPSVPVDVDTVGPALADFLSEVATVAVVDRKDVDVYSARNGSREPIRESIAATQLDDAAMRETKEDSEGHVLTKFSALLRKMKRFDPYVPLRFKSKHAISHFETQMAGGDGAGGTRDLSSSSMIHEGRHFKTLSLAISDVGFNRYKSNYQKMQAKTNLGLHHNQRNVTLVLESEADVWVACGGSNSTLPANTWLTKGTHNVIGTTSPLHSLRDVSYAFFSSIESFTRWTVPYITNGDTFTNQLFKLGYYHEEITRWDKMFRVFKHGLGKDMPIHFDVVDVLKMGGYTQHYGDGDILKSADLLVATSILCGLARPESAIDDMIYRDLQNPDRVERAVSMVDAPLDGTKIHAIANHFRIGKEIILREFSDNMPVVPGGPDAILIKDPEYRRRFISLIRANNEIQKMNRNSISSDRRARLSEQEHIKRECLYFFKQENGTAAPINSDFIL